MNRGLTHHYEEGGPMHAVAPREDDAEDGATQTPPEEGLREDAAKRGGKDSNVHRKHSLSNGVSGDELRRSGSPRSQPSTPQPNGTGNGHGNTAWSVTSHPSNSIPASRFEIFPPIPGMTGRRRPGRPFGSRTRHRASMTPARRNTSTYYNGSPGGGSRRTRSMLGEAEVVNGLGEEEEHEAAEEDEKDDEAVLDDHGDEEGDEEGDEDAADGDQDADADADADADGEEEDAEGEPDE